MQSNHDFSPGAWMRALQSPDGQQLLSLLRQTDPTILNQAMQAARRGDSATAQALLAPLVQDKAIAVLLRRLQGGEGHE